MTDTPFLEVRDLTVGFGRGKSESKVVRGVSLAIRPGQRIGLFGESGSGKTMTALSVAMLLPESARTAGGIYLDGANLLAMSERHRARIRGARIAMVHQNPMTALNPTRRIGAQLVDAIRVHHRLSGEAAKSEAVRLLEEVGVADAGARLSAYPHEFSGGMRQRVVIAMALAGNPGLIIADEATTALDVTTQALVIDLLRNTSESRGAAVIFVSHDLAAASEFCTDVCVMYAGRIVEKAPARTFYRSPRHPYSQALLNCVSDLELDPSRPIDSIEGYPPLPRQVPSGCAFHSRCKYVTQLCRTAAPPVVAIGDTLVECHHAVELASSGTAAGRP